MKPFYIFLCLSFIILGCNSKSNTSVSSPVIEDSTTTMIVGDSVVTFSDSDEPLENTSINPEQNSDQNQENEELRNFVSDFIKAEFYQSRQELMDQSKENGYIISEVADQGSTLKYSVDFSDIDGSQEFSCVPKMGENNFLFSGEKNAVRLYFDQTRLAQKWDSDRKTNNGESLESKRFWPEKNLNIHILVTYLEYEDKSIFTMRRKLILPN